MNSDDERDILDKIMQITPQLDQSGDLKIVPQQLLETDLSHLVFEHQGVQKIDSVKLIPYLIKCIHVLKKELDKKD